MQRMWENVWFNVYISMWCVHGPLKVVGFQYIQTSHWMMHPLHIRIHIMSYAKAKACTLYTHTCKMFMNETHKSFARNNNNLCFTFSDAPPVMLYSFIEQTLQPGPAVSLKCSAAGNPTPQVTWTLDGFPLPSNGRYVSKEYNNQIIEINCTEWRLGIEYADDPFKLWKNNNRWCCLCIV